MLNHAVTFRAVYISAAKINQRLLLALNLVGASILTSRIILSAMLLITLSGLRVPGQHETKPDVRALPIGETVERELNGGEQHHYTINLKPEEFLQVRVEQEGVDVVLRLMDISGKELARMDSPNETKGMETLSFVAQENGTFMFEVSSFDTKAKKGLYTIHGEAPRKANVQDIKRVATERTFVEGMMARDTEGQKGQAVTKLEEALDGWQELKDDYMSQMTSQQIEQLKQEGELTEEQKIKSQRAAALLEEVTKLKVLESPNVLILPQVVQEAIDKSLDALKNCQDVNNKTCEAVSLFALARLHQTKKDAQEALSYYKQTLGAINSGKAKSDLMQRIEIETLNRMGSVYSDQSMYEEALGKYTQALSLHGEDKEDKMTAELLSNIGEAQSHLMEPVEAEAAFLKGKRIYQKLNMQYDVGVVLNNLGDLYSEQVNTYVKALNTHLEAENLLETSPENSSYLDRRIWNLLSIARDYDRLNNKEQAKHYNNKADALLKSIKDPDVRLIVYIDKALEFKAARDYQRSLAVFQEALDSIENNGSRVEVFAKTEILKQMGFIYLRLRQSEQAGEVFKKAFNLSKDLDDKTYLWRFYNDIGQGLYNGGVFDKAIEYYGYAFSLTMSNRSMDFDAQAEILTSLGKVLLETKDINGALTNFRTSLWMRTVFGTKQDIAETFHDLMIAFTKMGRIRLAIFWGKQAINLNQDFRKSIALLDLETQKAFLKGNRETYERLAELLIQEGRFEEAQEVINRYQDQEFFDFASPKSSSLKPLSLTEHERTVADQYEKFSAKLRPLGQLLQGLNLRLKSRKLTEQERQELEQVEVPFKESAHEFDETFKKIEADFEQPVSTRDKFENVDDVQGMKTALKDADRKIAVIYTFITENNFYALLTTPSGIKAFSTSIRGVDLNNKVQGYLDILRSSNRNPYDACSKLYNIIFKSTLTQNTKTTLAMELEEYRPEVLLWSLDKTLRYVPVAALYDAERKEYLLEKYQTAIFTRVSPKSFLGKRERWTEGLGLGTFKKDLTEIFGDAETGKEGIMSGEVLLNLDFTQKKMVGALKVKRRPVVHIASHFFFKPGNAQKSYLLLGDNNRFTLADMQKYPDLFTDVDLLTLSACETSAQQPNAYGTEIDGFAELTQRLGARSVIATLWSVPAEETSQLMLEFYQLHKKNLDWAKSASLRQAQLNFLKGKASGSKASLSHPHYWGAFVLYGSFR